MACEFTALLQTVALNNPVLFTTSVPCRSGRVYHNEGDGIFQLKGMNRRAGCGCPRLTEYLVTFTGNIAIPEGGTVGPIAIALAIDGEPMTGSRAIFTPAAVDQYGNVTARKTIKIPWGCCPAVSVEYINGSINDPTFVPTPVISIEGTLDIDPVNE